MYCSFCGYPLGKTDNYCPNCGHMVPGREKTVLKKAIKTVRDLQKNTEGGRRRFLPWRNRSAAADSNDMEDASEVSAVSSDQPAEDTNTTGSDRPVDAKEASREDSTAQSDAQDNAGERDAAAGTPQGAPADPEHRTSPDRTSPLGSAGSSLSPGSTSSFERTPSSLHASSSDGTSDGTSSDAPDAGGSSPASSGAFDAAAHVRDENDNKGHENDDHGLKEHEDEGIEEPRAAQGGPQKAPAGAEDAPAAPDKHTEDEERGGILPEKESLKKEPLPEKSLLKEPTPSPEDTDTTDDGIQIIDISNAADDAYFTSAFVSFDDDDSDGTDISDTEDIEIETDAEDDAFEDTEGTDGSSAGKERKDDSPLPDDDRVLFSSSKEARTGRIRDADSAGSFSGSGSSSLSKEDERASSAERGDGLPLSGGGDFTSESSGSEPSGFSSSGVRSDAIGEDSRGKEKAITRAQEDLLDDGRMRHARPGMASFSDSAFGGTPSDRAPSDREVPGEEASGISVEDISDSRSPDAFRSDEYDADSVFLENTVREMAKRSMEKIAQQKGYFCYACGNYINIGRAEKSLEPVCRICGAEIIFPESSGRMLARSMLSNILSDVTNRPRNTKLARPRIEEYYRSSWYRKHRIPFEDVVADKRMIGGYLVDRQLQKVISTFPDRSFHIFTNVLIPEPNGSYQEIDALFIYGKIIFVLECKNRSGKFYYEKLSAKTWVQELGNDTAQKQKNIVSPVLQNEDHICALKHYLFTRGLTVSYGISYINLVVLGSYAEYMDDYDMKDDVFDRAVLTLGKVCSCDQLADTISGLIRTFDSGTQNLDEEISSGDFSDDAAERIEFGLMPQLNLTKEERENFLASRKQIHDACLPLPWRHYVLEGIRHRPYVIRTNDIYLEYCSRNVFTWEDAHPAGLVLNMDGSPAWNPLIQSVIDKSSGGRSGKVRAEYLPDKKSLVKALSFMAKGKAYHPSEDEELRERLKKRAQAERYAQAEQPYGDDNAMNGYGGEPQGQSYYGEGGYDSGGDTGYTSSSGYAGDNEENFYKGGASQDNYAYGDAYSEGEEEYGDRYGGGYGPYSGSSRGERAGTSYGFTKEPAVYTPVFFAGCDSLEKLNTRFKLLSRAFHPDESSGDEDTFKRMSEEYERMKRALGQ